MIPDKRQKAKDALVHYFGVVGLALCNDYDYKRLAIEEGITGIIDDIFDGVKQEVAVELVAGWQEAKAIIDAREEQEDEATS